MPFDPSGRQQAVQKRLLAASRVLEDAGITDARLEAEMLLAAVVGIPRKQLLCEINLFLTHEQEDRFQEWLNRRLDGEPVAYLEGWQGFYGLEFEVNRQVLIPRADSECLVDAALEFLPTNSKVRIADLGTGSGCLLQSTLYHRPGCRGLAVDLSADALALAQRNAKQLGIADRIQFIQGSWLDCAAENSLQLILCNPPYVHPSEPLGPGVADFEPAMALFTPHDDPFYEYRRVLNLAPQVLTPGGQLLFEVGFGRAEDVTAIGEQAGLELVQVVRDLAGIERLVQFQRRP
jgi:release factor glutamine methyltransferase